MEQLSPQDMELGLGMVKALDRPKDKELRIIMFTACYFVLDGVTLTIRRLESHLRAAGAQVKIVTTVPEDVDEDQLKDGTQRKGLKS
jgi:hypothetical protein